MSGYLISRSLQTVLTLFVMSILVFVGLYLVGNPVDVLLSSTATPAERGGDPGLAKQQVQDRADTRQRDEQEQPRRPRIRLAPFQQHRADDDGKVHSGERQPCRRAKTDHPSPRIPFR